VIESKGQKRKASLENTMKEIGDVPLPHPSRLQLILLKIKS
jgi:hypothetical protein